MDKISDEKLENELADVIFSTIRLARMMDLDVSEILKNKMEILKERFK
jgi:NTP pyrophosphatase (non-canonical NTP hydrolase)